MRGAYDNYVYQPGDLDTGGRLHHAYSFKVGCEVLYDKVDGHLFIPLHLSTTGMVVVNIDKEGRFSKPARTNLTLDKFWGCKRFAVMDGAIVVGTRTASDLSVANNRRLQVHVFVRREVTTNSELPQVGTLAELLALPGIGLLNEGQLESKGRLFVSADKGAIDAIDKWGHFVASANPHWWEGPRWSVRIHLWGNLIRCVPLGRRAVAAKSLLHRADAVASPLSPSVSPLHRADAVASRRRHVRAACHAASISPRP